MLNYIPKKAYAGHIDGDNIPQGKAPKHAEDPTKANQTDQIFSYLQQQRDGDPVDTKQDVIDQTELTSPCDTQDGEVLTGELVTKTANNIFSKSDRVDLSSDTYTPYKAGTIRVKPLTAEHNRQLFNIKQKTGGIAKIDKYLNLRNLDNLYRTVTLNSPLLGAAGIGVGGYFLGKAAYPLLHALLGPTANAVKNKFIPFAGGSDHIERPSDQDIRNAGYITAGLGALLALVPHFNTNRPFFGLGSYMKKKSNAVPFINSNNAIPLGMAREAIAGNTTLSPIARMEAMNVLNALPNQNQNAGVTTNALLNASINNGIAASKDAAVGYLTAHVLGLPNPAKNAISTGLTSFILRDIF